MPAGGEGVVTVPDERTRNRGQAYTLEGIVGGVVILMAILLTLQALVVTPTTAGSLSAHDRADLRVQAEDALLTIGQTDADEGLSLSTLVRYWDQGNRTFVGGINEEVGYGSRSPPANVGTILNETFIQRGFQYNLELYYMGPSNASGADHEPGYLPVVYRGQAAGESVTASQRVTLYDNQTLSSQSPTTRGVELWQFDTNATNGRDGYYPVPDAVDGPVYNVVEVRLTVW